MVDGEGWSTVGESDEVALTRAGKAEELYLQVYPVLLTQGRQGLQMVGVTDA